MPRLALLSVGLLFSLFAKSQSAVDSCTTQPCSLIMKAINSLEALEAEKVLLSNKTDKLKLEIATNEHTLETTDSDQMIKELRMENIYLVELLTNTQSNVSTIINRQRVLTREVLELDSIYRNELKDHPFLVREVDDFYSFFGAKPLVNSGRQGDGVNVFYYWLVGITLFFGLLIFLNRKDII